MPDSPIQTAALAALEQQRAVLSAAAQQRLAGLGVTSTLAVEHVDLDAGLVVLSDGTVSLGVYSDGQFAPVVEGDGHWTRTAGPFTSLAALADDAGWAS